MKKIIPTLLGLIAISGSAIILPFQPASAMLSSKITDFSQHPPIGALGQPLGKITTISGIVRQAASGGKSRRLDLVLSINAVNNRSLPKPVTIPFQIFETAKVVKPFLGQPFRYLGYETGGFTGVPAEAFKWVPAVATTGHRFETVYQILQENLEKVKTKADLIRLHDQRVQIVGKYIATPQQSPTSDNANIVDPITGRPILRKSYATVNIELADGTLVPLYSPLNKLSLRPSQEVQDFDGKQVSIIGSLASQPSSPSIKPKSSITIARMDHIELYQKQ